jgi:hypothetical protein
MSQQDQPGDEYKTVRISAAAYYKVSEMAGLMSTILGQPIPMTQILELIITGAHAEAYPRLLKTLQNPQEIRRIREDIRKQALEYSDLFSPDYWQKQQLGSK